MATQVTSEFVSDLDNYLSRVEIRESWSEAERTNRQREAAKLQRSLLQLVASAASTSKRRRKPEAKRELAIAG